ncbi:DUF1772 domain-containing protein [Paracidobacterium acidisoli]|uniref:DUF1772 domain-containing protein n=1 Tax=Paracidobacterium acidisoli TaxID=2303751 RepID=A0A372IJ03_9BACT|nr:DUF1772 domain-containing protein [Paracidobacterium acidisoli]MBT9333181.1 DUF1772 domain-containing protein [Paracidobacterium acidisoli]
MMHILNIATIVSIGLLTGTEFAVSAFINPVLWQMEDRSQARAVSLFAKKLGTAMPFWYVLSFLLLIAEAVLQRHASGLPLLIAAGTIWATVILLTLLFLVPINNRMGRLQADSFPEEAKREHHRWDAMHRLRVAALGAALVCLLLAAGV